MNRTGKWFYLAGTLDYDQKNRRDVVPRPSWVIRGYSDLFRITAEIGFLKF